MGQFIAVIGLLFHYLIANIFSAFYFLIYPKIKFLHWNKVTNAIIYGIFVWLVMNLLVVPLSRAQHFPFNIRNAILEVFILIICVGIPITIMASYFIAGKYEWPDKVLAIYPKNYFMKKVTGIDTKIEKIVSSVTK